ncbi:uncharacterized protein PFL1_01098 [Pseudozyma flocculosa PF-1]|uniref:Uncharacterized protein n=1 Tax=Pseudozyma flocculosa TaxID=84751 RepID=A0A5C3FBM8_9BASI|nr:uncharacterized protein PFL1_01098 [Pseudozyma flocculosa PF-1]EPQ31766.1 hypothetical protein PFL1_01098 [Pseudozyma flocculosa PF-1]SPO41844.1 uncharacterized protein PSFLO_07326 [Pseudozyma flocculosa]
MGPKCSRKETATAKAPAQVAPAEPVANMQATGDTGPRQDAPTASQQVGSAKQELPTSSATTAATAATVATTIAPITSVTVQTPASEPPKKLFFTFKRRRYYEDVFAEVIDVVSGFAYLVTEQQRKQYLAYAAKKRKSAKQKSTTSMRQHTEAVNRLTEAGGSRAPRARKRKVNGNFFDDYEDDEESREIDADEAILGKRVGSAQGWIFHQDAPLMRSPQRFEAMDCVDQETLQMAIRLFGPNNTSKVPACPGIADGSLLVLHYVRLAPEFRGHGYGMRLCAELLRHWQPYWSKAILLPLILNPDRDGKMGAEYQEANRRLSAAFQRIGFVPLGSTDYLYQEQAGFDERYRNFDVRRNTNADVAPNLCMCVDGVSERMRHAIKIAAEAEYVSLRESVEIGNRDMRQLGICYSHAFLPPTSADNMAHLKGLLHIAGTIGTLSHQAVAPSPANVAAALEHDAFFNFIDPDGAVLCRAFLGQGGSILDALDLLLYKARRKVELNFERDLYELPGCEEDPATNAYLACHLPKCAEHDDDFEGLRQRWWRDGGRSAHQRGPYRAVPLSYAEGLDDYDYDYDSDDEELIGGVPARVWSMYLLESGQMPRVGTLDRL